MSVVTEKLHDGGRLSMLSWDFTDAHALEGGAGFLPDDQLPSVTTTVEVKELRSSN